MGCVPSAPYCDYPPAHKLAGAKPIGDISYEDVIKFQYCSGWGYSTPATLTQQKIDERYSGKFRFQMIQDEGITGNFEITAIFKNKSKRDGVLVHSKKYNNQDFPENDWTAFFKRMDDAIKANSWLNSNE